MGGYAWVTLATNDSYSLGALVLAHSLKKAKTAHQSVVLITPAVSQPMREQLQTVFDVVRVVDVLDSKDEAHLALMKRPELGITFTKIHCWRLVEFDKCVFLDADTLVVRNCDELFERDEFSAAPDVSWPDCFNSGVFVFKPSVDTFNGLLQFAVEKGSFDGGDQGLLNQFFSDWATEDIKKHLPFVYNLTSVAAYSYVPAFKHYGSETRIVHFIGAGKPWLQQLDPATRTITPTSGSEHLAPLLQQWWDLFCEKVHPNLDKNLEGSYDGMSHRAVDGWTNSLPVALTDESERPRLSEPCTPYREKDDFRQYNLPYQPFDVRGSSGELLNVEFLVASVVHPSEGGEGSSGEQQRREGGGRREEGGGEEERGSAGSEGRGKNEGNAEESEEKREKEKAETSGEGNEDFKEAEVRINEWKAEEREEGKGEREEQKEQPEEAKQTEQTEQPPPPSDPFDYETFFPDETCINNYLQQNVMTYQPYDNHHHNHHNSASPKQDSSNNSTPPHSTASENTPQNTTNSNEDCFHQLNDSVTDTSPPSSHPQPQDSPPSLPRFLTIPENDKRQSGNTETPFPKETPPKKDPAPELPPPTEEQPQPPPPPPKERTEEKRELVKSKSMPFLCFDVTEMPPPRSVWKSQPDVSVDPCRKFSMPRLKPILPRQSSFTRSVTSVIPKVTLYTEFLMSSEYKDPADLPKDKVGFVEALIHRKGGLRRSKSAADIGDRFGPLPYSSPETEQPIVLKKIPFRHLDNGLYDLSQCKRQLGNKPKAKGEERAKENCHVLPALKPLVPPKEKKSTLIKKRKSKELSPGDGGREKMMKREPKRPRERKRTSKAVPRNVSETASGNNVDEILQRLREFSRNYQHFFGEVPQRGGAKGKNAAAECDTSERFSKSGRPSTGAASKGTQPGVDKPDRQGSAVDSEFRQFRNYVKEKSKKSQKGLLSIQDLVSETVRGGERDGKERKTSSEASSDHSDSKIKVISPGHAGGAEEKAGAAREKEGSGGGEVEENREEGRGVSTSEADSGGDSNRAAETVLHSKWTFQSTEGSRSSDPAATTANPTAATSPQREDAAPKPPAVNGETEGKRNGLEVESSDVGNDKMESAEEFDSKENTENPKTNAEEPGRLESTQNDSSHPEAVSNAAEPDSPPGETPAADHSEVETCAHKLNIETAAAVVSTENVKENGNDGTSRLEINGGRSEGKFKDGGAGEKPPRCGETSAKPKLVDEILCVPDFDTPRSSRVVLPTSASVATEVLEEVVRKATAPKSEASEQPRSLPGPGKSRKPKSRTPPGPRLANGNASPNGSPDGTDPAGEKPSPPAPSTLHNGNAVRESQDEGSLRSGSGIAGAIAQLSLDAGTAQTSQSATPASAAHQEYLRRQNWETGNVDYMGRDSFDNIWSKICQTLEGKEAEATGGAAVAKPSEASAGVAAEKAGESSGPPVPPGSAVLQKCPEVIETLPPESVAGPVEDDEMIFSKPDDRQSCLTNIKEEEEVGTGGSVPGGKALEGGNVKLSDILKPETASGLKEKSKPGESGGKVPEAREAADKKEAEVAPQAMKPAGEKTGEPVPVATKPCGEKPAEPIPETPKPVQQKAAEPVSRVTKPAGEKPAEAVPTATKPAEQKPAETAPATTKPAEQKPAETAPATTKPAEQKPAEPVPAATKPTEQKPAETVPATTKPAEQKPAETAPATTKPAEPVPAATKPTEQKPAETAPATTKPAEQKPAEPVPAATKPTEQKPAEPVPAATKPTEQKPAETVPATTKPAEQKPAETVPGATKPTEQKPAEPVPVATKAAEQKPAELTEQKPAETIPGATQPTGEKLGGPVPEAAKPSGETKAPTGGEKEKQPEKPVEVKGQPEPGKAECKTVVVCEPVPSPAPPCEEKKGETGESEKKPGECTTVAIPSPPIVFPGAPFDDKGKTQSKGKDGKPENEKFAPIPLPPPESPSVAAGEDASAKRSDSPKDEGKQKKGVFTKILEMVGVAPKEKPETETSKSVFYVEGAAPSKQESAGPEAEAAVVAVEAKEEPAKDDAGKPAEGQPAQEIKAEAKPEDAKGVPPPEPTPAVPPKPEEATPAPAKPDGKSKPSKPGRNSSPKESKQPSAATIPVSPVKSKSPSPKLTLPDKPPVTAVTMPTPPPQSDAPPMKNSALLKVDETILETPPVPEPPKDEESVKGKVLTEVEDMMGKAKSEVESRLQDRRSAEKEPGESTELINTMKLMVGGEEGAQSPDAEVEELKVTSEEERMRHKGEVVSSKLSDQILKAIPPPRRKAISEASASSSAIPKPPPAPEQKPAPGDPKAKNSKPSSIPVPPPRSRGKPAQQTPPSKGKGKK